MEDQGKRLLLAIVIALGIMLGWQVLFPPKKPGPEDEKGAPPVTTAVGPSGAGPTTPGAAPAPQAAPTAAARGPEREVVLAFPAFRATFSSYGGALKSWELLGDSFHGADGKAENLVRDRDESRWFFQVSFPGSTYAIAPAGEWTVGQQTATSVSFTRREGALELTKTYTIHPDDFLIELAIDAKNEGGVAAQQNLVISVGSVQDPAQVKALHTRGVRVPREWKAACYANGEVTAWSAPGLVGKPQEVRGDVGWFGFTYPYFMAGVALEPPRDGAPEAVTCRASAPTSGAGPMLVEAIYPTAAVAPGAAHRWVVAGYLGPKYMKKLEAVAQTLGWGKTGFERAIDLGWWGFIARPLLWLLDFFYSLFGNWPLAIVLLTITMKLATLYWTHKSMRSMKAMSRLRPELDKLKDKYKDDKQRQQVETMNLFKAHGVNPLAGCLPMVLQMPIWLALYRALSVAAELYHAPFLWVSDLTAADPLFILPVVMTGTMLLQSTMTPTTATGMQQKMMSYGMPLVFGGMSLFFPAGLTLYISTNGVFTLLHHLFLRAQDRRLARAVVVADAVDVPSTRDDADEEDPADEAGATKASRKAAGRRRSRGRGGRRR